MKNSNRTGIWIPREIESIQNLSITEKYLLSEIRSLSLAKGCFASNAYFANLLGKKPDTISRIISKLKNLGLISQKSFDGRRREISYCLGSKSNADLEIANQSIAKKSNADSELNPAPLVLCTTKSKSNTISSSWEEFKNWSKTLAPSTFEIISKAEAPEKLQTREFLFWTNFQAQKSKISASGRGGGYLTHAPAM